MHAFDQVWYVVRLRAGHLVLRHCTRGGKPLIDLLDRLEAGPFEEEVEAHEAFSAIDH